jgi:peptide methionine sulfoxide reductase msrA/msrB
MNNKIKMKNILILLSVVLGIAVFATSCGDAKQKSTENKKNNAMNKVNSLMDAGLKARENN